MKVKDLIKKLQEFDENLDVFGEDGEYGPYRVKHLEFRKDEDGYYGEKFTGIFLN